MAGSPFAGLPLSGLRAGPGERDMGLAASTCPGTSDFTAPLPLSGDAGDQVCVSVSLPASTLLGSTDGFGVVVSAIDASNDAACPSDSPEIR